MNNRCPRPSLLTLQTLGGGDATNPLAGRGQPPWPHPRVQYAFGPPVATRPTVLGAERAHRFCQREGHCQQGHVGHAAIWAEGPSGWDLTLLLTLSRILCQAPSLCFRCLPSSSLHTLCEGPLLLTSFTARKPQPTYGLRVQLYTALQAAASHQSASPCRAKPTSPSSLHGCCQDRLWQ